MRMGEKMNKSAFRVIFTVFKVINDDIGICNDPHFDINCISFKNLRLNISHENSGIKKTPYNRENFSQEKFSILPIK